jgi:hypothetical protein
MKRLLLFVFPVAFLSSCIIENVDPLYSYDTRDRIVGYYEVTERSETYNSTTYYSLRISKSHYSNEIYLNNFYAAGITVRATFNNNHIHIPFQVLDGYEVEGAGTVYGNEIDFTYRVKDLYTNSYADFCETTAVFDY